MRTPLLAAACLLSLAACDEPKPRNVPPPSPQAAAPAVAAAPAGAAAAEGALSAGLAKRPEMAGFYLDRVGEASDPLVKKPALTSAGSPLVISGFGFDPIAKVPAKGVDVVVDGVAYPTTYGANRQDVATYTKVPALVPVGFTTTLPADTLKPGEHTVVVRVVASDGGSYFDSPVARITVR